MSLLGLAVFLLNFGFFLLFGFLPLCSLFRDLESDFLFTFLAFGATLVVSSFLSSSSSSSEDGLFDAASSSDSGNWKKIRFYH